MKKDGELPAFYSKPTVIFPDSITWERNQNTSKSVMISIGGKGMAKDAISADEENAVKVGQGSS